MTVSKYEPGLPATTTGVVAGAPLRLVEWAEEAHAANQLAKALSRTAFAGAYKGDIDGATAAILKGAEVGLTPVTALGSFDLIQGVPAPKAITLRALVQAHGHTVWIEVSTARECVAHARRKGEQEVHTSRWTIERAQRLGLTGKGNWKQQPEAMLQARATAEVCRLAAADVILGIGYAAEEVADAEPLPTVTVTRARPAEPTRRTVQRAPARRAPAPVAEEPDFDEPVPVGPPPVSSAQLKKIGAAMRDAGITDRAEALAYVSQVIGRDVSSRNELNHDEASLLIDALEALAAAPADDVVDAVEVDPETGEVIPGDLWDGAEQ